MMDQQVEGTCLVVGAAMVFALVALVVNVDPLPLLPATECRFVVSLIVSVSFMLFFKKSRGLSWLGPPGLRRILLLKSATSYGFILLWWAALRHAPMGDCIAIIYTSPIFISVISRIVLGELLPKEFPLQVFLVAAGTVFILDPPFLHQAMAPEMPGPQRDYSLVFASLFMCSLAPIFTRQARDCSWIEVEFVNAALAAIVLNPLLLFADYLLHDTVPQIPAAAPAEAGLIILAAFGAFVGIAMETKGYQLAETGKASMFRYVEVPFAYVLQHFGTDTPVAPKAAVGAVLILASCGIGLVGQTMRKKAEAQAKTAEEPLLENTDGAAA